VSDSIVETSHSYVNDKVYNLEKWANQSETYQAAARLRWVWGSNIKELHIWGREVLDITVDVIETKEPLTYKPAQASVNTQYSKVLEKHGILPTKQSEIKRLDSTVSVSSRVHNGVISTMESEIQKGNLDMALVKAEVTKQRRNMSKTVITNLTEQELKSSLEEFYEAKIKSLTVELGELKQKVEVLETKVTKHDEALVSLLMTTQNISRVEAIRKLDS
jgi:hypothetical protein